MSIEDLREKSNPGTLISFGEEKAPNFRDKIKPLYTLILLIVIASIFFALGRLSSLEEKKSPIKVSYPNTSQTSAAALAIPSITETDTTKQNTPITQSEADGEVIGVKTSKKYYLPWCGVLKRAKPENQVHFASPDLARAAGYVAGGGCKGLK